jgi:hypothetical protein
VGWWLRGSRISDAFTLAARSRRGRGLSTAHSRASHANAALKMTTLKKMGQQERASGLIKED